MKNIKTSTQLLDLKGAPLQEGDTKITIGLLVSNVLSTVQSSNPHRAYTLARQFAQEKEVDLKAEDIVFLKEHLTKSTLGSLYIGQAVEILEASDK